MQVQAQTTQLPGTEPLSKRRFRLQWETVALFSLTSCLVFLTGWIFKTSGSVPGENAGDLPALTISFRPVKNAGTINLVATATTSTSTRLYVFFSLKDKNTTLLFPGLNSLDRIPEQPISFILTPDLIQAAKERKGFLSVAVVKPNVSLLTKEELVTSAGEKPSVGENLQHKLKEMTSQGDADCQRVELPDPVTAYLAPPSNPHVVATPAAKPTAPVARTSAPGTATGWPATAPRQSAQTSPAVGRPAVTRRVITQTRPPIDDEDDLPTNGQGNWEQAIQGQKMTGQQIQKQRF